MVLSPLPEACSNLNVSGLLIQGSPLPSPLSSVNRQPPLQVRMPHVLHLAIILAGRLFEVLIIIIAYHGGKMAQIRSTKVSLRNLSPENKELIEISLFIM